MIFFLFKTRPGVEKRSHTWNGSRDVYWVYLYLSYGLPYQVGNQAILKLRLYKRSLNSPQHSLDLNSDFSSFHNSWSSIVLIYLFFSRFLFICLHPSNLCKICETCILSITSMRYPTKKSIIEDLVFSSEIFPTLNGLFLLWYGIPLSIFILHYAYRIEAFECNLNIVGYYISQIYSEPL